jgi:predicted Fe-S protein YdhL (DUF1289 family)
MSDPQEPAVESPCIRNCCLDDADVCMGCFRTLREICDWHAASVAEKRDILRKCEERRAHHVSRPRTRGF